ncbi:MAG: translocation/assembly module TamB, partial [Bacteroidia bacterium]|nr:translocation/assembly module TamB [Bacteroidia bacterium]
LKIKKFKTLSDLLIPDLKISTGTILEGDFNAANSELTLKGNADSIKYKGYEIKKWYINASSLAQSIDISTGMDKAWITDSFYVANFKLNTRSFDSKSGFEVLWDNEAKLKNSGDLKGEVVFSNNDLDIHLRKMQIFIADSLWVLNDSTDHITFDTTGMVNLRNLRFENHKQMINLQGKISKNPNDFLEVEFQNFRLAQINPLIKSSQLKMQGTLSGKARVSDIFNKVIFTSDFDFANLYLNDRGLGNGKVKSIYDAAKEVVSIDGYFSKGLMSLSDGKRIDNIQFNGYYYPSKKENNIDVTAKVKALDITILQPYLKGILTFNKGFVEGEAVIKGSVSKPEITGRLNLVAVGNLKVDYLNTYYSANGTIKIFPDRIQLGDDAPTNLSLPDPIHLYDERGKEATVWGNIFHDNFKIEKLDFDINANNFLVLNTTGANNPDYFGKAFVSGNVGIYGNLDYMNLDINLKTEKGTIFNIPLSGPASVSENDFIIFVKADTSDNNKIVYKNSLSGMNLNFNLEATPDAKIRLIFDEKAGDVIEARGAGNISMQISTTGKFEMYGLYTLIDGNYLFSLENFISKKFDIENGSTIKWSGDPLNADINITASYRQRAGLTPFFPSDSTGQYSKRVPANCMLYMRDKLLTPEITFGIQLPTVDESTRIAVMSYINNEQELNRQVFSLLILKSFVTPLQLSNSGVGVGAGAAAGATSSEMLSNQISNWLSQLSTNIDIAVNYQPGTSISNEQLELALSKQLFNDRLSIDGNVGVNNSATQKTSNMIGDLVMDYKVYPDGKLRVKGFNKSNDNTQITTQGGPFTQGVGIFYREEFNTIDELYDRYLGWLKKKKKKPVTPAVTP